MVQMEALSTLHLFDQNLKTLMENLTIDNLKKSLGDFIKLQRGKFFKYYGSF